MNIVAHPTKLLPDPKTKRYPVPRLYDINGGANWYNKADNGFTVYRNFDTKIIDLHIQKVKFKEHGEIGVVQFKYDLRSGRFIELDDTDSFTQDSTPVKMDLK
jgi:twinkle protein